MQQKSQVWCWGAAIIKLLGSSFQETAAGASAEDCFSEVALHLRYCRLRRGKPRHAGLSMGDNGESLAETTPRQWR